MVNQADKQVAAVAGDQMTNRDRFVRASRCRPVDRPPIWLMRQAGRVLPEYRALKEKHSFLEMVRTPELATEVTLQPIRRFDFDAAIIFSDILVINEALGQPYHFKEGGGISIEPIHAEQIPLLSPGSIRERLDYVPAALRMVKSALANRTALIGFSGSPWTLACFMLEGAGVKEYSRAKLLFRTHRALFEQLFDKLTESIIHYFDMQIEAGVDALQLFDSLGGILAPHEFEAGSSLWMKRIIESVKGRVPVIVFSKDTHGNWKELAETGASIIGVDWTVPLRPIRDSLPESIGVQGNLDPSFLQTTAPVAAHETQRLLEEMRGSTGHIFNLGHGVPPNAHLDCVEAVVNTVRQFA